MAAIEDTIGRSGPYEDLCLALEEEAAGSVTSHMIECRRTAWLLRHYHVREIYTDEFERRMRERRA